MIKLSQTMRQGIEMCRGIPKSMEKCAEVAQPGRALG
jgi:hypothetical protein